jgi:hypothetical protein
VNSPVHFAPSVGTDTYKNPDSRTATLPKVSIVQVMEH